MITQKQINELKDEKIKTEISNEQEYNYQEIISALRRAKNQLGYLTLQQIAQAVMLGIGDDLPTFLGVLVQELLNKISTPKVAKK